MLTSQDKAVQRTPARRWLLWYAGLNAAAAAGVWVIGPSGRCPQEVLGALLAFTLLGGVLVSGWAAWDLRTRNLVPTILSGSLALGAAASGSLVAFQVLTNFDAVLTPANEGDAGADTPGRLRLVDLNVLHGYPDFRDQEGRFRDTLAALKALRPDVLILQEAWDTADNGRMADRLARALGLHHVYARANGSRRLIGFEEGAAVLSRFPIKEARRLVLSPRKPWWENRIAIVAAVDLGDETLTVVGVHLTYESEEAGRRQAESLLSRLPGEGSLVVAGDLNAGPGSPAVRVFLDAGFVDTVPGGIDHVFFPRALDASGWAVQSADWTLRSVDLVELIGRSAEISDHPGIVVDLVRWRPSNGRAPRRARRFPVP